MAITDSLALDGLVQLSLYLGLGLPIQNHLHLIQGGDIFEELD
jgi:hypothetical protein